MFRSHTQGASFVVVGAGYAGRMALGRLRQARPHARITLVEPRSHYEERIQLHRTAATGFQARHSLEPLCRRLRVAHRPSRLIRHEGTELQLEGGTLGCDAVILAMGSRTQHPPGPAHVLDSVDGALQIFAALRENPAAHVTVVGAGSTAIELVTQIAHHHPRARCTLWGDIQLGSEIARDHLEHTLRRLGVRRKPGRVVHIDEGSARSAREALAHDLIVWCTGFRPSGTGAFDVDATLMHTPGVFVAGDLARLDGIPNGCVTALPMGAHAAANAVRFVDGRPLERFAWRNVLTCVDLGPGNALIQTYDRSGDPGAVWTGRTAAAGKALILAGVRSIITLEARTGWPLYTWAGPGPSLLEAT